MTALSVTMQAFFTQRLTQRDASPHTIAAYRDSFRLLLGYTTTPPASPPATSISTTWGQRESATSCSTSKQSVTRALRRGMLGSLPSIRCFASPSIATPST